MRYSASGGGKRRASRGAATRRDVAPSGSVARERPRGNQTTSGTRKDSGAWEPAPDGSKVSWMRQRGRASLDDEPASGPRRAADRKPVSVRVWADVPLGPVGAGEKLPPLTPPAPPEPAEPMV